MGSWRRVYRSISDYPIARDYFRIALLDQLLSLSSPELVELAGLAGKLFWAGPPRISGKDCNEQSLETLASPATHYWPGATSAQLYAGPAILLNMARLGHVLFFEAPAKNGHFVHPRKADQLLRTNRSQKKRAPPDGL